MNDHHNETLAVLKDIDRRGKVTVDDLGTVANAAFRDGANNTVAAICEELSPANLSAGIRYAIASDPSVAEALRGKRHEEIVVAYRHILGLVQKLVERHRIPKGGA
jgi:hypothetical protein